MTDTRPTERQSQDAIIEAAMSMNFLVHAERPARTQGSWRTAIQGQPGWPDLVILGGGRLIVRELKRLPNTATSEQHEWISRLREAGVDADFLWVPEQQESFIDYLGQIRNDHLQRRIS